MKEIIAKVDFIAITININLNVSFSFSFCIREFLIVRVHFHRHYCYYSHDPQNWSHSLLVRIDTPESFISATLTNYLPSFQTHLHMKYFNIIFLDFST